MREGSNASIRQENVEIARNCMEHRAIWMALIYDEMVKAGVPDAEQITRKAIYRCGQYHGAGIKEQCGGSSDCRKFACAFNSDLDLGIFEAEMSSQQDAVQVDFHHCPLLSGWQKLGLDEERLALLCDMAMEGDRGIAAENGLRLDLKETLACGDAVCKMELHR